MTRADVAARDVFAAALVGASATLAGLAFVAVSINISRILSVPHLPGRAGETVILFLGAVCECALVLILTPASHGAPLGASHRRDSRLYGPRCDRSARARLADRSARRPGSLPG